MWEAYLGLESAMNIREPWIPLRAYLADATGAASIQPVAPIRLPPDTPPGIAQQIWNNVMTQALQNVNAPATRVPFELLAAVCESVRLASECRAKGTLSGSLQPNGEIKLNVLESSGGWKQADNA